MANKATPKKGITVPKPKTVSMRKYSELKAKYDKLTEEAAKVGAENVQLKQLNNKQAEELRRLQASPSNDELKSACAMTGPIVNQEFIVLDKIVNEIAGLNPFQRRTVVAGFLSSIKERMKYEARQRQENAIDASIRNGHAQSELNEQENGMCAMAEIITSFGAK